MQKILKSYFKTIGRQSVHDDSGSIGKRWTSPVYDESTIVLTENKKKIIGWTLPENRILRQVGIVGMGGLVTDHFEKNIWVAISKTLNEEDITRTMLKQLGEDANGLDMAQILPKIKKPQISERRRKLGTILKTAFASDEEAQKHTELEEVGNDIVKKYGGLPPAIETIGEVWSRIYMNFHDALATRESRSYVMASSQLSYDELSIRLKQCLLRLSIRRTPEIWAEQLASWRGTVRLSNLQELSGFKLVGGANKDVCRQVSSKICINPEGCEREEIFQKLDRLSSPPHLQELYLRYYHGTFPPQRMNPTLLCHLQFLYIDNGDLKSMGPSFKGTNGFTWKDEGLCLRFLARLPVEWEMVQRAMPRIKYVKVSHCYVFKSFPCNIDKLGVWRR
ncbi:hypothetical protein P3X46_027104 [Hevea brasiliensis]|uniref:NB-ARC domain-containing protein n=1 Tax=Hevea brasiliensis TaxID=3981 RepID=A0ABQ9L150_HEVBR|nr:hypothetical protein P3X46_027104 [Hevea brasiliensis]